MDRTRITVIYLSVLLGLLAYCLTYMLGVAYIIRHIGFDKLLNNEITARMILILIGAVMFSTVFMVTYRLLVGKLKIHKTQPQ